MAKGTEVLLSPTARLLSEGNPRPAEIEGIVELRPALRAKELEKAFADLVAGGKRPHPRGAPRNPLQLGATFWHFRRESRVTSPRAWAAPRLGADVDAGHQIGGFSATASPLTVKT